MQNAECKIEERGRRVDSRIGTVFCLVRRGDIFALLDSDGRKERFQMF